MLKRNLNVIFADGFAVISCSVVALLVLFLKKKNHSQFRESCKSRQSVFKTQFLLPSKSRKIFRVFFTTGGIAAEKSQQIINQPLIFRI